MKKSALETNNWAYKTYLFLYAQFSLCILIIFSLFFPFWALQARHSLFAQNFMYSWAYILSLDAIAQFHEFSL